MRYSARIVIFLLLFLIGSVFLNGRANAQEISKEPPVDQKVLDQEAFGLESNVEPNLENGIQVILIKTIGAVSCQITGINPTTPDQACLGVNPETGKIGYVKDGGGAIAVVGQLISYTFTPPASSVQYVGYLKENFGLTKPAYAQGADLCNDNKNGLGFCGIQPLLPLWVVMRNFVYLIFILVFVIIGVAIMLRIHIDPRTVMTVQNQIPKIIIGIVLVTFSFAFAGLLIDIMYFSTYMLGSVIADAPIIVDGQTTTINEQRLDQIVLANDPAQAAHLAYSGGIAAIIGDSSRMVSDFIAEIFTNTGPNEEKAYIDRFANGDPVGSVVQGVVKWFIGALAFLIIGFGVLFVLLRLFVILIFSYINVILDIIFAPFWFLLGLMPGGSMGYGAWFRDMLANLSVFPATVCMLLLANYFGHAFRAPTDQLFSPPMLTNTQSPSTISAIIALGFFFMMPNILTIMKGALKAPKLNLGPVFQPASVGAKISKSLIKKPIELGDKYRYTHGSERFATLFKIVGNPMYNAGKGKPGAH